MTFSICILTGGQSSRMGTDKSQLYFHGEKLIDKMLRISREFSDDVFIAGRPCRTITPTTFYEDIETEKGPLSGILTAITHSKHDFVLVLACDMPFISENTLQWLSKEQKLLDNETIAFASVNGNDHYLAGFYHRSLLEDINTALNSDNLRVRQLLNTNVFKTLNVPNELSMGFTNINTPEDLDTFGAMKIKIIAFGQAQEMIGEKELQWITEKTDVSGLREELVSKFPALKSLSFRLALNETLVDNAELNMNDTVAILPPFAGG